MKEEKLNELVLVCDFKPYFVKSVHRHMLSCLKYDIGDFKCWISFDI